MTKCVQRVKVEGYLTCKAYENITKEHDWEVILGNNTQKQFDIAQVVKSRRKYRKQIIDKYEAGHPQVASGSMAPGDCSSVLHLFYL